MLRVFRTRGLPIFRQLQLEEALLRADDGNWLLLNDGSRDPAVVLGISGDPHKLTHPHKTHAANIPLIKRFSGGGTVIVDKDTIFATMIFGTKALPDVEPFPRQIMEFTAGVYGDAFSLLDRDASRVPKSRVTALTRDADAAFSLTDNDYVIGNHKIAGNAQAITKDRWLHHTSFLWDFRQQRMDMLKEPEKRPKYRGGRKHASFLCPLITLGYKRQDFLEAIEDSFEALGYEVQLAELSDVEAFLERPHLKTSRVLDYDLLLQKPVSTS